MAFVLDASVALAWHFKDETWPAADPLARRAVLDGIVVPSFFAMEISNGLLRGERMKRTVRHDAEAFVARLANIPTEIDLQIEPIAYATLLPLARDHGLRLYDAAYLHLSSTRSLPLATFDRDLRAAAIAIGVTLLGASA